MAYLVFCTFDLKNATAANYQTAYVDLEKIGLRKVHKGSGGSNVVIPTTAAMGEFEGTSASNVRDDVSKQVQSAFTKRGFKSRNLCRRRRGLGLGRSDELSRGYYWYAAVAVLRRDRY